MATLKSEISHLALVTSKSVALPPRLPVQRRISRPASWKSHSLYTVLLACPEGEYLDGLVGHLSSQGFKVATASKAETVLAGVIAGEKTSVFVASDLPDMTSVELLIRLRELGVRAPIAMMTDTYDEAHEDIAFEFGAVELLYRTQSKAIISKRLNLLAAGSKKHVENEYPGSSEIRVNELVLKPGAHSATWRGQKVQLTFTEFRIIQLLASRPGMPRTFREIYDVVHGIGFTAGSGPDGHHTNVRSLIRKIRIRFASADPTFDQIENTAGVGYSWRLKSERASQPPSLLNASLPQQSVVCDISKWRDR